MDIISAVRMIKIYNKEVDRFLLNRTWFEDTRVKKIKLSTEHDKIRIIIKKVFPKSKTEEILGDISKNYFGKSNTEDIIKLLNTDDKIGLKESDDASFFLSENYKKIVW